MKVVIKRHMQAFCLLERKVILVHNLDADLDAGAGVAAEPPCVEVSTKIREISKNEEGPYVPSWTNCNRILTPI